MSAMISAQDRESIVTANQPSKKLALVIGNNNYEHGDKLKCCVNDAHDVANALERIGFKTSVGTDLSYVNMIQLILQFQRQIHAEDLVVFYYSGHGTQWEDQNYIMGIDNKCLADDTEMYRYHAIRVQLVLESMAKRRPSAIVILLDCCRKYVIESQALSYAPLTKSVPQNVTGLAPMKGVAGSLIVFACGSNEVVVEDPRNVRNSIFTFYLLKHMNKPNLKIDELMCHVCNDVYQATNEKSCCYRLSSLCTPNVYLNIQQEGQTCVLLPSTYRNEKLQNQIDECESRSTLNLHDQNLTDEDMNIVVQHAIINKQCKYLRLSQNQITSQGVSIIASALKSFNCLETLNLSNNSISDSGMNFLSEKLLTNNSLLTVLSLSSNQITDMGVHYLAKMLHTNRTLLFLNLSLNEIGDQGIESLSRVLSQYNTTLQELYLNENKLIGDSSIDSLMSIFKRNRTLKTFQINNCNLSEQSRNKLRKVIRWNFSCSIKL